MQIEHDAADSRFVARLPEGEAFLAYQRAGADTLDFQHTVVPGPARGQGVAEALVAAAFDYARANHQRVIPTCGYVREWLEEHPEAQELLVAM